MQVNIHLYIIYNITGICSVDGNGDGWRLQRNIPITLSFPPYLTIPYGKELWLWYLYNVILWYLYNVPGFSWLGA
jgi:hypothetical protein